MIVPTDFDWCESDAVVLREQPATAVYLNANGAIVIRQERAWDEDSDTLVIIQPERAEAIAAAILRVAGHTATNRPAVEDETDAERKRGRRPKQRDSHGTVTARDRDEAKLTLRLVP